MSYFRNQKHNRNNNILEHKKSLVMSFVLHLGCLAVQKLCVKSVTLFWYFLNCHMLKDSQRNTSNYVTYVTIPQTGIDRSATDVSVSGPRR